MATIVTLYLALAIFGLSLTGININLKICNLIKELIVTRVVKQFSRFWRPPDLMVASILSLSGAAMDIFYSTFFLSGDH